MKDVICINGTDASQYPQKLLKGKIKTQSWEEARYFFWSITEWFFFWRGGDTNLICSHSLLSDVFPSLCQHPELLQSQYIHRLSSKIWFMLMDSPWITMCRLTGDTLSDLSPWVLAGGANLAGFMDFLSVVIALRWPVTKRLIGSGRWWVGGYVGV